MRTGERGGYVTNAAGFYFGAQIQRDDESIVGASVGRKVMIKKVSLITADPCKWQRYQVSLSAQTHFILQHLRKNCMLVKKNQQSLHYLSVKNIPLHLPPHNHHPK